MEKGPRLWPLLKSSKLTSHSSGQCQYEKNEHDQTQATARVVPPAPAVRPRGECTDQQKDQEHKQNRRHEQPPCGFASAVVTDKLSETHGSASRVDVVYRCEKSLADRKSSQRFQASYFSHAGCPQSQAISVSAAPASLQN